MMALEGLAVAASATQLAAYGLSITSFIAAQYDKLQSLPQQYEEYSLQLKLLVNTSTSISRNPALQTPEVQVHLAAILDEVKALQALLCAPALDFTNASFIRRYWGAVNQSHEQRKVALHLQRLEQKNKVLCLLITSMNAEQLYSVKGGVDELLLRDRNCLTDEAKAVNTDIYTKYHLSDEEDLDRALVRLERRTSPECGASAVSRKAPTPRHHHKPPPAPLRSAHTYGATKLRDKSFIMQGNTYSSLAQPHEATETVKTAKQVDLVVRSGKTFGKVTVGNSNKIHLGDTGTASSGVIQVHDFCGLEAGDNTVLVMGDFDSLETRNAAMQWNFSGSRESPCDMDR
jgi:hypothetical protein